MYPCLRNPVEKEISREDPLAQGRMCEDGCALPSVELGGSSDCVVPELVNVYSESPLDDATCQFFVGKLRCMHKAYLANHGIPGKMVGSAKRVLLSECPDSRLSNSSACFIHLTPESTFDLRIKWYTNSNRECEGQHPECELLTAG